VELHVSGDFDAALAALQAICQADVRVVLTITPQPDRMDWYEEHLPALARELTDRYGNRVSVRLSRAITVDDDGVAGLDGNAILDFERRVQTLDEAIAPHTSLSDEPTASCGYGWSLTVQPDGSVYACELAEGEPVGNAAQDGLEVIQRKLWAAAETIGVREMNPCCHCDFRFLCGGPCRVMCASRYGDPRVGECSAERKTLMLDRLLAVHETLRST
jgi:radical SAM protein with 4Fe4S-binding SPASM domain